MKTVWTFFLIAGILAACTSSIQPKVENTPLPAGQQTQTSFPVLRPWWKSAVFYEIFVRSFSDSNGDGIGDFNGITEKLDYLQQLGITAIWLMPIHPSASYHGYDVLNYFNVNPDYGTMDDFKHLLDAAHARGIHVIIDLVLNHTSDQNPWFIDANNNPQSPYRNWYIWSDTNPGYLGPIGVAWHPGKHGWYYGIFGSSMPDLNYNNPAVTAEMKKVVQFWLKNVGVDGFRIDAANYLIEEGQKQVNTPSTHQWFKGFYSAYKADNPDAFTVGEVYGSDPSLAATYTGNQMDMVFNFELAADMVQSTSGQSNSAIDSALTFSKQALPNWTFATFLTNHDQNRVMSDLNGNVDQAKVAAYLLLTSPGTPFIYYGEEIGMEGQKPDEDIRLPFEWSSGLNAGFTSGTPWRAPQATSLQMNVSAESSDPNSILSFYRTMIGIRRRDPIFATGGLSLLSTVDPGVYAALRTQTGEGVILLVNLTGKPIRDYSLSLQKGPLSDGTYVLQDELSSGSFSNLTVVKGTFNRFTPIPELAPFSNYILRLIPLVLPA